MTKKKQTDCTGTIGFCWPWYGKYSNGKLPPKPWPKGIGFSEMTDIKLDKRTRDIPVLVFGNKKDESVAINFCPFCGADYNKLGRL